MHYGGKKPQGICDRTGFQFPHDELVKEYRDGRWTGMLIHKSHVDPDHPQLRLETLKLNDPRPIKNARPDQEEKPLSSSEKSSISNFFDAY